jgi:hypothetical protein
MKATSNKKPFVAPKLREEASLVDVTLTSNGGGTHSRRQGSSHGSRQGNAGRRHHGRGRGH